MFVAPVVDRYQPPWAGLYVWLIGPLLVATLASVWLADAARRTPIDVATLVSPVICLTSSVAIGDVAVDTDALEQELPGRALYQVLGLLLGKLFSTSVGSSLQWEPFHIIGTVLVAEVVALVTLLPCWRRDFNGRVSVPTVTSPEGEG